MKPVKTILLVLTNYFVASKCYQFPNVTVPQYYVPIVNIRGINASIVFLKHNNNDDLLLRSLILGLYSDQSVILAKGGYLKAREGLLNKYPNVILLSNERITINELNSKPFHIILESCWSPVYLILTVRDGSMTCENGKFNKSFLKEIEDCMNHIWQTHRIVRLIVSFPYTCPNHFIIFGGKKESNTELYDRTIKIIEAKDKKELETAIMANSRYQQLTADYPLRANIFNRFPTSIKICDKIDIYKKMNFNYTNDFCGSDALIMNDYIDHYQFNLSLPNDDTCNIYGFEEQDTHRMTGSLSCIIDNKMDISFNSRFMVQYTTDRFFYLHYIATDSLAVILKRPDEIPLWHYPFNGMGLRAAITLNALILVLGVITWASAWITREIENRNPRPLYIYIANAICCTLFGFPIKRSNRFRMLKGTSLVCSIILLAFYQGHINYLFTTKMRYKGLKTLSELYRSQYTLYTSPSILSLLLSEKNDQDKEQLAFYNRTRFREEGIGYILEHENTVTTSRGEDVNIEVLLNYTDGAGAPRMYLLDEPFDVYYLSYICRTGFLFTEETVRFMMRLLEAGLPVKYYAWTRRTLKLGADFHQPTAEPRPTDRLTLRDIRVAFTMLATGCIVSAIVFLIEVYRGNAKKKYKVAMS